MTDKGQNESGADESEDNEEEFELEGMMDRDQGAAVLRRVADGVERGTVELGGDDGTVSVPKQFELEFEFEETGDERELEVEIEWSTDEETDE